MPELPEVEVTRLMLCQEIKGKVIQRVLIHHTQLRWKIPLEIQSIIPGLSVEGIVRRGKYLLLQFRVGVLLIHLGMSGSLIIHSLQKQRGKHEHIEFIFTDFVLRFCDPRRFGCVLWTTLSPLTHHLLIKLGPEPFAEQAFTADYLYLLSRKRKISIKCFIMDSKVVVGVGNIYATEALFLARIHPEKSVGSLDKLAYERLVQAIRTVLSAAIKQGGTTLKDFRSGRGKTGYFKVALQVYGRAQQACRACGTLLDAMKIAGRTSVYCKYCQKA